MDDKTLCKELEQKIMVLEKKISEVEKREAKLREIEKKYEELLEYLPETIFELDMAFDITFVNRNGFEIFGYNQEEFDKGINGLDIIAPADRPRAAENIAKVLMGEVLGLTDYTAIRKEGSTFPIMIHSTAIKDKGRTVGIRGFIIDASEKKKIESQLYQAQRLEAVGVLAGGIAHDFNNILSIIVANIEFIIQKKPEGDPERVGLQNAVDASFRARDLVSQLMAFSRFKEKERFPLKINLILKESLKLLGPLIPQNINLIQKIHYEAGEVFSDPSEINQLVLNLCMNAIHAMEENGGTLNVSLMNVEIDERTASEYQLAECGTYLRLAVKDTGSGVDPKIQDRIFEPYFTTKEKGKGTGLGLSVVYGIVKEYGGSIKIDSGPGKGTTVTVLFPVVKKTSEVEPGKALVV